MNSTLSALDGYRVIEKIGEGSRTQVYRGSHLLDQKSVVLKLLKSEYPTFNELVQFRNQYAIAKNLDQQTLARLHNPTEYSLRFIEQVTVKGKPKAVAVFEGFDGDELDIKQGKLATKVDFEAGLFHQQAFREAMERFQVVLRINPRDKVAQIYRDCCQTSQTEVQPLKA